MTQPSVMQVDGDDSGPVYTQKLNEIISAHNTGFAGTSPPTNPVANMWWQDTTSEPPTYRRRNSSNSAWEIVAKFENGTLVGDCTGSAGSTVKLNTARAIGLTGDASGSASFDGTANAVINVTLANSGITAGTYGSSTQIPRITFDSKGRATGISLQGLSYPITSFNGRGGAVSLNTADVFNVLPAKSGNALKVLRLNDAENGVEWARSDLPVTPTSQASTFVVDTIDHMKWVWFVGGDGETMILSATALPGTYTRVFAGTYGLNISGLTIGNTFLDAGQWASFTVMNNPGGSSAGWVRGAG